MEEESRAVELALGGHNLVNVWFVLYTNYVSITEKDNYIYIFGTIVTMLMLDNVFSWSLMMR